jgi:hypothetical protein
MIAFIGAAVVILYLVLKWTGLLDDLAGGRSAAARPVRRRAARTRPPDDRRLEVFRRFFDDAEKPEDEAAE